MTAALLVVLAVYVVGVIAWFSIYTYLATDPLEDDRYRFARRALGAPVWPLIGVGDVAVLLRRLQDLAATREEG